MEERAPLGYALLLMSADADSTRSAAADAAAAPLTYCWAMPPPACCAG